MQSNIVAAYEAQCNRYGLTKAEESKSRCNVFFINGSENIVNLYVDARVTKAEEKASNYGQSGHGCDHSNVLSVLQFIHTHTHTL